MPSESTILVVDDNPQILSGTARLLGNAGYHTLEARTGQEALDAARKHLPDLILLDNHLPDVNGLEVCRQLKADKATAGIFISIVSGSLTDAADKTEGLETGADEYLVRPIGNRELLARVRSMLRLRTAEKELARHRDRLEALVVEKTAELNQEVAEHRQARKALEASREFSRSVLDSLTAHIAVLDENGTILAVNRAWQTFARDNNGQKTAVRPGVNYFDVCKSAFGTLDDEHAMLSIDGIAAVMRGEKTGFSLEYPCHSPDEQRFFQMKVLPLSGVKKNVVVAHENITQLKQAETGLRQRSHEMAMLNMVTIQATQSLSAASVATNALKGILEATNASAAFLLRKEGGELIPIGAEYADINRPFEEFPVHKLGECLCGMAVTERKGIYSTDIQNDPRCTWEECKKAGMRSAAALPLFSGEKVIAVLGLGTDEPHDFEAHTEYLETLAAAVALGLQNAWLFEQTRQTAHDLETEVKKRTLELEKSQKALMRSLEDVKKKKVEIEAANERLQELDRLKSMFIASMSHELRTPLNSIIGFTGILLQGLAGALNEEQKDQLERVSRAGKHLLALITDVIDVSKIEAGRIDLYPEEVDLEALVEEAVTTLAKEAAQKGLALHADISGPIRIYTDRRRLFQCLINLLSNAVKYSEQGGVTVSARAADEKVAIRVSDTGIGIAKADLPLLFTSFVRLESHLKTRTPGTGLGLYLTHKIVIELLGGEIRVASRLGEGSAFTLLLPAVLASGT
jgi:signal transduction histidine kinase/DNA-binding response OmpR family regulator